MRTFYAIYNPDGFDHPNIRGTLYRYDTATHRAEDIERVNRQRADVTLMQAVPRAFAQKRFPRAFARDVIVWRPWSDGDRHFTAPIWSDDEHGAQEYTGRPRNVITDRYEVRQVDAWNDGEGWTYNESWHLGTFTTTGDPARAFRRALANLGIVFYRGRTVTEYDGDVYEIVDRATGEPLFCAIPEEV